MLAARQALRNALAKLPPFWAWTCDPDSNVAGATAVLFMLTKSGAANTWFVNVAAAATSKVSIDGSQMPATLANLYRMAADGRVVDVNKAAGAATSILLPMSPTLWAEYIIIDGRGNAATNPITVTAASGTTINGKSSLVIGGNNLARGLRAVSPTTWRIT